ncbi:MAG TPA: hypothetical protein VEF92_01290 [Burkholderiales bacterium]|nr:hypothetical protein [Burkholderiales bacterium]
MNRTLRHLLVAFALVFAQQAAQQHALSHVRHDLIKAQFGGKGVPPVGHPAEKCIAYHAVGSTLPGAAPAVCVPQGSLPALASVTLPIPFAPRIDFDSRAPPFLS